MSDSESTETPGGTPHPDANAVIAAFGGIRPMAALISWCSSLSIKPMETDWGTESRYLPIPFRPNPNTVILPCIW